MSTMETSAERAERAARYEAVDQLRRVALNWDLRHWQIDAVESQLRAIVGVYRERTEHRVVPGGKS